MAKASLGDLLSNVDLDAIIEGQSRLNAWLLDVAFIRVFTAFTIPWSSWKKSLLRLVSSALTAHTIHEQTPGSLQLCCEQFGGTTPCAEELCCLLKSCRDR